MSSSFKFTTDIGEMEALPKSQTLIYNNELYIMQIVVSYNPYKQDFLNHEEFSNIRWEDIMFARKTLVDGITKIHLAPRTSFRLSDRIGEVYMFWFHLVEPNVSLGQRIIRERTRIAVGQVVQSKRAIQHEAVCMATHARLGCESGLSVLDDDLIAQICAYV